MNEQHGPDFLTRHLGQLSAGSIRRKSLSLEELEHLQQQQGAARHYAGHHAGLHPEDSPYLTTEYNRQMLARQHVGARVPSRASSAPAEADDEEQEELEEDERYYTTRQPTSARRYLPTATGQVIQQGNRRYVLHHAPPRGTRSIPHQDTWEEPVSRSRRRQFSVHWLLMLGIAMCPMLLGWMALNILGQWLQTTQDDWHYSRPRTYQVDAVVGHHDSQSNPSHFIALNLDRHVIVIELQGGDPSKAVIYTGPVLVGDGQDLTPVTLTFKDVNGDGKPDMLVHLLDQTIVYLNDGTRFSPLKPGEQVTL